MNQKQLITLLVVAAVVGGFGWYSYQKRQSSFERSTEGAKLLQGVAPETIRDVAQLSIKHGAQEANLTRGADGWTVKERGNYPANFDTITEVVRKLYDLKVTRNVEVGPSRLPQLKLTKQDGTVVDLKDDKGKSIVALTLGLQATKESPQESPFGGGGSFPSGRYVMRGEDVKTVALINDPLSNVEAKPEDWLNKNWFKVEKSRAITVVSPSETNSWKMVRETESGDWKLADAKPGETADSSKTSGLNWLLSSPAFNDVVVDPKADKLGLDKPTVATIETFDGFTYTIKIGKAEGENHALQLAVAANLPKERTPGKDEKKEDKDKLDKEFADKRKQLEEKLKTEQKFEKWTYLVSNWTVESLLKSRKDFLAEKKEETKKDDAAAPAPAPAAPKL